MKNTKFIILIIISILLLTSCSTKDNIISYSNLIDISTQDDVAKILIDFGIPRKNVDNFFMFVNDFNNRTNNPASFKNGFNPIEKSLVDYSDIVVEQRDLYEMNSRLSSFTLIKDFVRVSKKVNTLDTFLMFDIDAIDKVEKFNIFNKNKNEFLGLFSSVDVSGMQTLDEHISAINNTIKNNGVVINLPNGVHLINVYLHSTFDNLRFVGHSGILIDDKDNDKLIFIEKFGPQYPFQVTKFNTINELKNYLLTRKDFYGEENELDPIIFDNNELLVAK